ncbi:MAG: hypothetical protein NT023_17395, partial [Armatimonadetes bacterium]|nr:hypothetical protein [Armatimonadota bacterium]
MILYLLTLLLGLNPPKTQPQPAQNGVLVVFKRVGTAYRYQGTLDKFTLPPTVANKGLLSFPKPPNKPSTQTNLDRQGYPYLFYVVKNENTASFYYSPDSKRFQDEEGVVVNLPPKEDALLKSFLSNAKPAPIQHRPVHVDASYPGTIDFHLKFLCKAADYIAVGRVVGVLREGHTPLNNTNDSSRHTVFLVAVEQYLKSATPQAPAILKIWQVGGWYSHASGDPLLGVGERYLL